MRLQIISGILALSGASVAVSPSAPWFLLSTSKVRDVPNKNRIQTSSEVLKYTTQVLSTCPTNQYLIIAQPGVRASDFRSAEECLMPHLCRAAYDPRVQSRFEVTEVLGNLGGIDLAQHVGAACASKGKEVGIAAVNLPPLSAGGRTRVLSQNDARLASQIMNVTASGSYTILFSSILIEPVYESQFIQPVHMDLKRDTNVPSERRSQNNSEWDKLHLFEKYQFFTPGIFMGFVTAIVLLSILRVGLKALSSLQVSYGAFEKDIGPNSQKKYH